MARPLRIEYPGAFYHITTRGNEKKKIFRDDKDRSVFFSVLNSVAQDYNWLCHSYCLMDNHYHLLIETPEANLSIGMRQLNGMYTQAFNLRHHRAGHLFQGRFKAFLIEKETYLLEVARYIVLNPVRAGLTKHPRGWLWSSFRALAGLGSAQTFLTLDGILGRFGKRRKLAQQRYREFVLAGIGQASPFTQIKEGIILGFPQFVDYVRGLADGKEAIQEVPISERLVGRPSLDDLFGDDKTLSIAKRNRAMKDARRFAGYSVKEIACHLGLHYTTVSRILNKK